MAESSNAATTREAGTGVTISPYIVDVGTLIQHCRKIIKQKEKTGVRVDLEIMQDDVNREFMQVETNFDFFEKFHKALCRQNKTVLYDAPLRQIYRKYQGEILSQTFDWITPEIVIELRTKDPKKPAILNLGQIYAWALELDDKKNDTTYFAMELLCWFYKLFINIADDPHQKMLLAKLYRRFGTQARISFESESSPTENFRGLIGSIFKFANMSGILPGEIDADEKIDEILSSMGETGLIDNALEAITEKFQSGNYQPAIQEMVQKIQSGNYAGAVETVTNHDEFQSRMDQFGFDRDTIEHVNKMGRELERKRLAQGKTPKEDSDNE